MNKMMDETLKNLVPTVQCHKCGKAIWTFTTENYVWECIYCGNLIYFSFGALEQQIDKVMLSKARGSDFIYSENGDYIRPRKDEHYKRLKFDGLLP